MPVDPRHVGTSLGRHGPAMNKVDVQLAEVGRVLGD